MFLQDENNEDWVKYRNAVIIVSFIVGVIFMISRIIDNGLTAYFITTQYGILKLFGYFFIGFIICYLLLIGIYKFVKKLLK